MTRRAMFMLKADAVHRALGLPDTVRVVALEAQQNPAVVNVVIEGAAIPPIGDQGEDDSTRQAWLDVVEAPRLWHPVERVRVWYGTWKVGDGEELHPCPYPAVGEPGPERGVDVGQVAGAVSVAESAGGKQDQIAALASVWDAVSVAANAGAGTREIESVVTDAVTFQDRERRFARRQQEVEDRDRAQQALEKAKARGTEQLVEAVGVATSLGLGAAEIADVTSRAVLDKEQVRERNLRGRIGMTGAVQ